jgi:eukaryotic-like serine/threonine-protein kinase
MTDKPPADEQPPPGDTLFVPGAAADPDRAAPAPAGEPAAEAGSAGTTAVAASDGATAVAERPAGDTTDEPVGPTVVDNLAARTTADPVPPRPRAREPRSGGQSTGAMEPAQLLGDRYRLDERIGSGGMGVVWRATDLMLARGVAVKLLRPEYTQDSNGRARFRAEARHAGSLSHPAIAQVYDYSEEDPAGQPYLVMELVNGPSLAWLLKEGPLDCALAMRIIGQAARGLQAAHANGLVHRDIKPGNLLVSPGWQVKITDFGIARLAGEATVTRTGAMICTPAYLAPERAAGAPATPAADLYSLGIVAYECLTGRVPFTGEPIAIALAHQERNLPPLPPNVPPPVAALIAALTAKRPEGRPGSAGEVATRALQLHAALSGPASGRNFGPAAGTAGTAGTATGARRPLPAAPPPYGSPPDGPPRGGTGPRNRGGRRVLRAPGTLPTRAAVGLAAVAVVGVAGLVVANLPKTPPHHPPGPVATGGKSSAAAPVTSAPGQPSTPRVISVPHTKKSHHAKHIGKARPTATPTPTPAPPSTSPAPSLTPTPSPSDSPTPSPSPSTPTPSPTPSGNPTAG